MKFKLTDEYLYWWPVKVEVPSEAASGRIDTQSFEMLFRAMPTDEVQVLTDEIAALAEPKERAAREHDHLLEICRDWRGVVDDDEQVVSFSAENLRSMLRFPFVRTGIYRAYSASISGEKARRGN